MNTTSHYKEKFKKNKPNKKNKLDIIKNKNNKIHIKLDTPIVDPNSNCFNYTYDLSTSINTDLNNISKNIDRISFCIYRIVHCKTQQNVKHPFLQYLLYKYPPSNNSSLSNMLVFPFIKFKNNFKSESNKFIENIIGKKIEPDGFIEKNKTVFIFYNISTLENNIINKVYYMNKNNELWWCIMDEICNHKKVLNFPIHKSVYNTFYKNPSLIYIKLNEKRIEIPTIAYYGNYFNFLPIVAALGQKGNNTKTKSDSLFFSSFKKAFRYGCWTDDYKEKSMYNEKISDIDGLYKRCGLIRFALFLGKINILDDIEYSKLDNYITSNNWKSEYNSLVLTRINFDNNILNIEPEYILKNFSQQTPLSYHEIDKTKLPSVWDPNFSDYNIL
jgi:hypothetical protein